MKTMSMLAATAVAALLLPVSVAPAQEAAQDVSREATQKSASAPLPSRTCPSCPRRRRWWMPCSNWPR